jgi:hypothetical protein
MKPERVCEISLRFQPPNTITIHLHSFKTITRFSFYSPSYSQPPRLIIIFLLKKLVGTNIFKIELKIMSGERKSSNDPNPPFKNKEKEGEGRSKVGGQRKEREKVLWLVANGRRRRRRRFPCLEANGMFQAWWPMEGEGEIPFHFPPNQFYLNLQFFPLTLRFYFTMVLGYYSRISFLSLIYKLRWRFLM